ncbi:MAG TPA: methylated-DNA--[protein]-cysteine S-methyltransferase [Nevskia sp.]|jgi:AraC family transcriptional regulator of adaptative response/methylated-DNA-[protein]-cysteine methyltransferase|nr:methylated-DNA--[protein]-cysteine S-methyltransferase [Nevskia sp.]
MSETIRYAQGDSSLGPFVVAASENGVVALQFGAAESLLPELELRFPEAAFTADCPGLAETLAAARRLIEQPAEMIDLPLDLRGSAFELRVWRALRRIPPGETTHYGAIATSLGTPRLSREVGQACAANPVAVAVPCHRVLKKDGSLSGYRWGLRRKRALLEREQAAAFHLSLQASG